MYSNKPIVYKKERRTKPDILCRWLQFSSAFVWIVLIVILFLYENAMPEVETFLDRLFGLTLRKTWDFRLLNTVFYLLFSLFIISSISLVLNLKRLKRKGDHLSVSLMISLACSVLGMILYVFVYL